MSGGGAAAHVQAQQAQHVLGDHAVALALQRGGLEEGVRLGVAPQPSRLLALAQQPQVLCALKGCLLIERHFYEPSPALQPLHHILASGQGMSGPHSMHDEP